MDLKGVAMVNTPIVEEEKKVEHTAERARNPHREESRRRFGFLFAEVEVVAESVINPTLSRW